MGKNNRFQRKKARKTVNKSPKLGYYIIVTDTEATERHYFNGFHNSLPEGIKPQIIIRVIETRTVNLVERCKAEINKKANPCEPWIVFDRDQVQRFDNIIKEAEKQGIRVAWSNPCIEVWFSAYFGKIPTYEDSVQCCRHFSERFQKITNVTYKKSSNRIYTLLQQYGDENNAIAVAQQRRKTVESAHSTKPSEMVSCTKVDTLILEIRSKIAE